MSTITNGKLEDYAFLSNLYIDESYPKPLVCRAKAILDRLCLQLETNPPADLQEFYKRTHAATLEFNDLEEDFEEQGCEIDSTARENILSDLLTIAKAYGYPNADPEELISPREW
ncbi:hypothetical protein SAMN02745181_3812 [Rubritalea squalenifaciens DSM 18772]|uniref:Uncharacterized protein n=1 Tax=Rubritalea squalenifaciens DSM 18772 TaxID=1123071 RepID=A0A1M6SFU0_9BACT|nr:DUF5713 family protein [Rubritalea squalenifaciens]SHK43437.1 hypothetical protein SAMN02745181_3812 [Rubritalea squalenifaciens DSM 18772]